MTKLRKKTPKLNNHQGHISLKLVLGINLRDSDLYESVVVFVGEENFGVFGIGVPGKLETANIAVFPPPAASPVAVGCHFLVAVPLTTNLHNFSINVHIHLHVIFPHH